MTGRRRSADAVCTQQICPRELRRRGPAPGTSAGTFDVRRASLATNVMDRCEDSLEAELDYMKLQAAIFFQKIQDRT